MSDWLVEVTRKVRLVVPATGHADARVKGLDAAWEWCPENAEGGDQGSASAVVVRAGDLPGHGPLVPVHLECGHEGSAWADEPGRVQLFRCPVCRCLRSESRENDDD